MSNSPYKISPESLPLAAEDRFLVIGVRKARSICPSGCHAASLGVALARAAELGSTFTPVLDLRGLETVYNDVVDFANLLQESGPDEGGKLRVIASQSVADQISASEIRHVDLVVARSGPLPCRALALRNFSEYVDSAGQPRDAMDDWAQSIYLGFYQDELHRAGVVSEEDELAIDFQCRSFDEFKSAYSTDSLVGPAKRMLGVEAKHLTCAVEDLLPEIYEHLTGLVSDTRKPGKHLKEFRDLLRAVTLLGMIREMHQHSLLVEMVFCPRGDSIRCVPYHAGGAHQIHAKGTSDLLIARPGIIAERVAATFSSEILEFEQILANPRTREKHIQAFLERYPAFLRGLGYKNLYPQVVLSRDDGTSLRPDFILEPFDGAWCDILDVKLPKERVIVGTRDRAALAAGIHEVAAQLREYAAYFEQDRYRKLVKDRYGLSVYRPRLIALVGRHVAPHDQLQVRRAMTQYEQMRMLTFDELVSHAQNRMLI